MGRGIIMIGFFENNAYFRRYNTCLYSYGLDATVVVLTVLVALHALSPILSKHHASLTTHIKHDTLTQCFFNVVPAPQTMEQH